MRYYDAAVIGGGVLGCFAARSLRRWQLTAVLLEAREDICAGVTRANSAIVYPGCDNRPGTMKARMAVRGNAGFGALCGELDIPFSRCGSLMTSCGPAGEAVLRKKLGQGIRNGVPGLRLLPGEAARELEPMLSGDVRLALYAPGTGTVNPWQLGIAAMENAVENGCELVTNCRVLGIRRGDGGYILETQGGEIACRCVINCAGMDADRVQELLFAPSVRIFPDAADFIVLDRRAKAPGRVIFHEAEESGKGVTAVPTVEGNLLLASPKRALSGAPWATEAKGLESLLRAAGSLLPGLDTGAVIRSFGGVRPNPHRVKLRGGTYVPDGGGISGFCIEHPGEGFWSLIGVKTPGLTCADQLGMHLARAAADYLGARENPDFNPQRRGLLRTKDMPLAQRAELAARDADYAEIICRCEGVTRGEIIEAIRRGARDAAGVKRRVGAGMGRCQGGRCGVEIEKILEEVLCHD